MSKKRANPLAQQAQALRDAADAGGVPLDPQQRTQMVLDQIQILLKRNNMAIVTRHQRPSVAQGADGSMHIHYPPPTWGVALLEAPKPAIVAPE